MSTVPDDEEAGERPPGENGTMAVLQAMLTTFSDVLAAMDQRMAAMESALVSLRTGEEWTTSLDQRMAAMESAMVSFRRDQDEAVELDHALHRLERVEVIEADLAAIRVALLDHPAATVYDVVAHLGRQVDSLVAQPGPGPAMAMVAAGLSERFEQRTQGLVELLQEHAELMHALTDQVQGAMQGLVSAVESRQAGLDGLLDTIRAVAHTIEGMGVRVEEARDGVDAVLRAGEDLPTVVRSLRELDNALRATAEVMEDGSLGGLTKLVRDQSGRIAALSASLDSMRELLGTHVEDTAHTLGRKASDVGRRLVAEFGLSAKPKPKPRPPPPPTRLGPPPVAASPPPKEPPPPRPKPRAKTKRTSTPSAPPPRTRVRKPGPKG